MALSRRIARPLLASIFIAGGLEAVRNPAGKVKKAETVTKPLSEIVDAMPSDPETLVRINGAVQISAGLLLATGKLRRLASLALIGSINPTTYAGHRFWEETDEVARAQQRIHFLKNLGLLGGLILAAVDTEGDPSLGWRTKRRAHQLEAALAMGRAASNADLRGAAGKAQKRASAAPKVIPLWGGGPSGAPISLRRRWLWGERPAMPTCEARQAKLRREHLPRRRSANTRSDGGMPPLAVRSEEPTRPASTRPRGPQPPVPLQPN